MKQTRQRVVTDPNAATVHAVAQKFATLIREAVGYKKWKEMCRRNAIEHVDALGDFCDPNPSMLDAIKSVLGSSGAHDWNTPLWNKAWRHAITTYMGSVPKVTKKARRMSPKEKLIVEALVALDAHAGDAEGAHPAAVALAESIKREGLYEAVWG